MLAGPLVLLLLPANFFDTGQSMCLSVLLLGKTCYGCGLTRGVQHFIHFDFDAAWQFNKLTFIVVPLLLIVWGAEVLSTFKKIKFNATRK